MGESTPGDIVWSVVIRKRNYVPQYDSNSSPLGRLAAESLTGQISRREVMSRRIVLGLSSSVIGNILSSQAG